MAQKTSHPVEEAVSRPKIYRLPDEPSQNIKLYLSRTLVILIIPVLLFILIPKTFQTKSSTPVASSPEAAVAKKNQSNISLESNDGSSQIIGQVTQLTTDKEDAVRIKTTKPIDPNAGKELLKIISQY